MGVENDSCPGMGNININNPKAENTMNFMNAFKLSGFRNSIRFFIDDLFLFFFFLWMLLRKPDKHHFSIISYFVDFAYI